MSEPAPSHPAADRNLLFGVLALQADLIDPGRFAEACAAWSTRKDTPLAELLVERGWLTPADRADVEKLLQRKLDKHKGDVRATLAEVTTDHMRQSLAGLTDPDIRQSLGGPTPPPLGHVLIATTDFAPETRDRYTLSRLHATGGIGRVWLARDAALGRDVALKELLPERARNPGVWARFLREAQVTGQLEHPGVVPIYEVGRRPNDQAPFYTMRFVRGRTLAEAVAAYHARRAQGEAGPLELRELLNAFVGVCNAVAYAHSRGVLHRDLKPQNVVLGDYGEVVVLDWGLARLMDEPEGDAAPVDVADVGAAGATVQGQVLGTPAYLSPEQAEGRQDLLGPCTDVHGLGAVLYEILVGSPPFTGSDTTEVLRRVRHREPDRPRLLVPDTPPALEAVCLKALAKKPANRYGTAKELSGEVQRWLADEPVSAWREPVQVRAGRWVRRHRTGVATALAALVVAVIGLLAVAAVQTESRRQLAGKNRELEESNLRLAAARDRAESRLDLAVAAIDNFNTAVDENLEVKEKPENKPLRKTLLQAPLAFYEKLRDDLRADDDAGAQARERLARSFQRLGVLNSEIGSQSDALKAYEESVTLLDSLVQQAPEPGRGGLQLRLAGTLNSLGSLQSESNQQADAARASLDRAQGILETQLRDGTADKDSRLMFARVLDNLASLDGQQGKTEAALERLRRSLEIVEEARRSGSDTLQSGVVLAETHLRIAKRLMDRKARLSDALSEAQASVQTAEPLTRAHPDDIPISMALCDGFLLIGEIQQSMGDITAALEHYRQGQAAAEAILRAHPSASRCRVKRIDCIRTVASTQGKLGKYAEGLETLRLARTASEELVRDNPTSKQFKNSLSKLWNRTASMHYALGQTAEALRSVESGATFLEELVRSNPNDLSSSRDLAGSYYNVGTLSQSLGHGDAAMASYQKSLKIRERLVDDHPDSADFPLDLASILGNIGVVQTNQGRFGEATASFERAVRILEELTRAEPKNMEYQSYLARARMNLGSSLNSLDRPEEGLAVLRPARDAFGRIALAQPKVVQNQLDLAGSQLIVAQVLVDAGRPGEAATEFDRAIVIFERLLKTTPDQSELSGDLMSSLLGRGQVHQTAGQIAKATQLYRRALGLAEKQTSPSAGILYHTACLRARLASLAGAAGSDVAPDEGKRQADLAVKALAQSIPGRPRAAAKLRTLSDFESLRQREDFQKILRDIESKEKAK